MSKYLERCIYTCRTCGSKFRVDDDTTPNIGIYVSKKPVNFCSIRCRVLFKMYAVDMSQFANLANSAEARQLIDEEMKEISKMIDEQKRSDD